MMTQHLSPEQAARAEALRTAAYILARPKALGSFSTTPPNVVEPVDVHSLAEYILNGGDHLGAYERVRARAIHDVLRTPALHAG